MKLADDYLALKSETVTTVVERIAAAGQPTSILVFGSRARGDAVIDSDLDLLVVKPTLVSNYFTFCSSLRGCLQDWVCVKFLLASMPRRR